MSELAPNRPLWLAALLGGIPPVLVAWIIGVTIFQMMGVVETFSSAWFTEILAMLFRFAIAFLGVQFLLFLIMTVAERRRAQPAVAWLCAGVAAITPLVLYSVWPDASVVPTWQILIVYFFGIAAAWITRRLRYGVWL